MERGAWGSILNYVVREVSPEITCEQKTEGEGSEPCGDLKEEYSGQREQRVLRPGGPSWNKEGPGVEHGKCGAGRVLEGGQTTPRAFIQSKMGSHV